MEKEKLAQRVKDLRKQKGLSQEDLSKKSGLSLRTIQRVENGESEPTGETLRRISNALGLTLEELANLINIGDVLKKTIKTKNEYLYIFDNKLIISTTDKIIDSVGDYEKSVSNIFKTLIVFIVFIPIFAVLATVFYNSQPHLSFYAGGSALFFLSMAIYTTMFTSGSPVIYRSSIKRVRLLNTIMGNAIYIDYLDKWRFKKRALLVTKDEIEGLKQTLLEENLSNNNDFKTDRKTIGYGGGIIFIAIFITFFTKSLFDNIAISGMWAYGTITIALSGFILSLIVKGVIDSYIWKKKQQTANIV
jgi:transcriptional regulator with XRE-family HTH domain